MCVLDIHYLYWMVIILCSLTYNTVKFAHREQTNKQKFCFLSQTCATCISDKDANSAPEVSELVCSLFPRCKLSLAALYLQTYYTKLADNETLNMDTPQRCRL